MTETLYLVLKRKKWNCVHIHRVTRRRPPVNFGEALLKLHIELPDGVLNPPTVKVNIAATDILQPVITVKPAANAPTP